VVSKDFVRSAIEQAEQDAIDVLERMAQDDALDEIVQDAEPGDVIDVLERMAQDDALDEIVQDAEPGDVIEVHELECDVDDDADVACTCRPLTLRFGAVA